MIQCEAVIVTVGATTTQRACPNTVRYKLMNSVLGDKVYPIRYYCAGHGVDRLEWERMKGDYEVALFDIEPYVGFEDELSYLHHEDDAAGIGEEE